MSKANVSTVVKDVVLPSIDASLDWFTDILNHVEGKEFYFAMAFIAIVGGFLLSRFGVGISLGSDFAAKGISVAKSKIDAWRESSRHSTKYLNHLNRRRK